jgi:hypothetical protein
MQKKGTLTSLYTDTVGESIGTMEINMEVPEETKNRISFNPTCYP